MSFGGKPTTLVDRNIPNDGFWPDLELAEFQASYRLPAEYLPELLVEGLTMGMGEVNVDLATRKGEWQALGFQALAGSGMDNELFYLASYRRAAYCRAKAFLLQQFATVSRRESAENLGKEAPERHEAFLAYSQQSVRTLQGRGRITAELI
jgi:hypothetical protein